MEYTRFMRRKTISCSLITAFQMPEVVRNTFSMQMYVWTLEIDLGRWLGKFIPSLLMTNTHSLIQCVAFTVFIFRYTILHLYVECSALGRFSSHCCCSIWQGHAHASSAALGNSTLQNNLIFFQLSESTAPLAGSPQKWSKSTQTPIIHFISSLKLCLLHMLRAAKDSHTWLVRQGK